MRWLGLWGVTKPSLYPFVFSSRLYLSKKEREVNGHHYTAPVNNQRFAPKIRLNASSLRKFFKDDIMDAYNSVDFGST